MSAENSKVKVVEVGKDICIKEESEMYRFETVEEMIHEVAVVRGKNAWSLVGVISLGLSASSTGFCLLIDGAHKSDVGEIIGGIGLFTSGIGFLIHAPRFANNLALTDKAIVAIQEYLNSSSG